MASAERTATTVWEGDLAHGNGTLSLKSGATGDLPVTWASRTERSDGKTSPEELIAAAHASCFSMALSNMLATDGNPPDSVQTDAVVTLRPVDGKPTIASIELTTVGVVPGIDEAKFIETAEAAKAGCPVSRALAGVPEITLKASLQNG